MTRCRGGRTGRGVEEELQLETTRFKTLFCPPSWATGLCEDLIKQNKGESRYSTRSMVLIKSAMSNDLDRSAIATPQFVRQFVNFIKLETNKTDVWTETPHKPSAGAVPVRGQRCGAGRAGVVWCDTRETPFPRQIETSTGHRCIGHAVTPLIIVLARSRHRSLCDTSPPTHPVAVAAACPIGLFPSYFTSSWHLKALQWWVPTVVYEHLPMQTGVHFINRLQNKIENTSTPKMLKTRIKLCLASNTFYSVDEFLAFNWETTR
ncbi:hypothetical protein J6590_041667 [Homalodisca vitripennis]|nr:hypothetical protein J6590_041667 [Homalodisca vitripennis]